MTDAAPRSTPSRHWLRSILIGLLVFAMFLVVAGFLYENIAESRDRRFNPMPGRLVDVGGRRMHIDCTGEGSPTVILDSGLGDTFLSWRKVQPEIAKVTRVCSYDRAGLGYSDSSSQPRTSQVIAEELHALLQAASVQPPYIVVGHSMGGYDVRVYTNLYRSEVVGMVLVIVASRPGKSLSARVEGYGRQLEHAKLNFLPTPRRSASRGCSAFAMTRPWSAQPNVISIRLAKRWPN